MNLNFVPALWLSFQRLGRNVGLKVTFCNQLRHFARRIKS